MILESERKAVAVMAAAFFGYWDKLLWKRNMVFDIMGEGCGFQKKIFIPY